MAEMKPLAGRSAPPGPDRMLLTLASVILLFGLVMVASASISLADKATGNPFYYLERQMVYAVIGAKIQLRVISCQMRRGRVARALQYICFHDWRIKPIIRPQFITV